MCDFICPVVLVFPHTVWVTEDKNTIFYTMTYIIILIALTKKQTNKQTNRPIINYNKRDDRGSSVFYNNTCMYEFKCV